MYDRHTTVKQPAEVAEESQKPTQGDTSDNSRMNSSAQSGDKDSDSALKKQTDGAESSLRGTPAEPQSVAEPTEAQKAAGNYKMEHRKVDGYNVSIENVKGSVRRGTGADGKPWETVMQNDYGYIRGI